MPPTNDPDAGPSGFAADALLARTRKAVLNVLVVVAMMIAASGGLLRYRAGQGGAPPARGLHDALLFALMAAAVVSYLIRRSGLRQTASRPPERRAAIFYRTHVGAAAVAALGVPIGLAYGWLVDPGLEGVAPFWVVPIALGFLAFPRRGEIDELATGD